MITTIGIISTSNLSHYLFFVVEMIKIKFFSKFDDYDTTLLNHEFQCSLSIEFNIRLKPTGSRDVKIPLVWWYLWLQWFNSGF